MRAAEGKTRLAQITLTRFDEYLRGNMQTTSAKTLLYGIWQNAPDNLDITAVVTDSRKVTPGCVFVAIKGERQDGHDFAKNALENGAAVVVASHAIQDVPARQTVIVEDVLDAMIAMGANYRAQFSPLVLGITGSVGKTTTKEFASAVFESFGSTLKTEGNQNNEIGLPNTLFKLTDDTRYAVIEMGMQGQGEIRKLTNAVRPGVAIITRVGLMHIQQLGSIENVLSAKMEIAEGIQPGGALILNGDDELLFAKAAPQGMQVVYAGIDNPECTVLAANIRQKDGGQVFDIIDRQYGRWETFIPALGRHTVQDALLAYTAATRFGLNAQQSAAALAGFVTAGMRQKTEEIRGVTLLEDFYNAGPDSMQAALELLAIWRTNGKRIAMLGDMLELGVVSDKEHRKLGYTANKLGIGLLVCVGTQAALAASEAEKHGTKTKVCNSNAEAAQVLLNEAKRGDVILMKASRGMKFEEILEDFREEK